MVLFEREMEQIQPHRIRVDLGVMSMKEYTTLPRSKLEPHMFSIIPKAPFWDDGILLLSRRCSQRILMSVDWMVYNQGKMNDNRPINARGVMVIVVGNGHSDKSSNPGRD